MPQEIFLIRIACRGNNSNTYYLGFRGRKSSTKKDALRLLITEDLSKDEAVIIEHEARLLTKGGKKSKRQASDILKALVG